MIRRRRHRENHFWPAFVDVLAALTACLVLVIGRNQSQIQSLSAQNRQLAASLASLPALQSDLEKLRREHNAGERQRLEQFKSDWATCRLTTHRAAIQTGFGSAPGNSLAGLAIHFPLPTDDFPACDSGLPAETLARAATALAALRRETGDLGGFGLRVSYLVVSAGDAQPTAAACANQLGDALRTSATPWSLSPSWGRSRSPTFTLAANLSLTEAESALATAAFQNSQPLPCQLRTPSTN